MAGLKVEDVFVSRADRYALGIDIENSQPVFLLPVTNRMTDYEEIYRLTIQEYEGFLGDRALALAFRDRAARRELDDRLVLKPGADRGYW